MFQLGGSSLWCFFALQEMAAQVRSEYQQHRDEADMQRAQFWYVLRGELCCLSLCARNGVVVRFADSVRLLLHACRYQEGERQLKTVLALVATTGPSGFDPFNMHQESRAAAYAQSDEPNTSRTAAASSGTHDDEGEVDTDSQGRLGVDWPWEGR